MTTHTQISLSAVDVTQTIEDLAPGPLILDCFWNLYVRILSDPFLKEHRRQFLTGLQAAVAARNGFSDGLLDTDEMLEGYEYLVLALHHLRRAFPHMHVTERKIRLTAVIEQIEICLQWN
jgi:hypothetical protein